MLSNEFSKHDISVHGFKINSMCIGIINVQVMNLWFGRIKLFMLLIISLFDISFAINVNECWSVNDFMIVNLLMKIYVLSVLPSQHW